MKKVKQFYGSYKNAAAVAGGVLIGALPFSASAAVTLPPEVTSTIADITTYVGLIFAAVIPVVGLVVGLSVLLKLFKRFTAKV